MPLEIVTAKLSGKPNDSGWVQLYEFKSQEPEKIKTRGELFAVIATSLPKQGVDVVLAGREVITRLHEEYFGRLQESAFEALKNAVKKVIEEFSSWEDVEIGALSYLSNCVYLVCGGGAKISVLRYQTLAPILLSEKGGVAAASGYPRADDIFIVATKEFSSSIPAGVVRAALDGKDPKSGVEALAPSIAYEESKGNLGAFFLKFEEKILAPQVQDRVAKSIPEFIQTSVKPAEMESDKDHIFQNKQMTIDPRQFFKRLKNPIQVWLEKFSEKKVYLKTGVDLEAKTQRKNVSASVGVVLLLILSVSIFFGIRQKKIITFRESYETKLNQAEHNYQEALELQSLNPQRSRELFNEARSSVLGLTTEGIKDPNLSRLKESIDESQGRILGEYQTSAETFVDLSLLTSGFVGEFMAESSGSLYVLDPTSRKLVKVIID